MKLIENKGVCNVESITNIYKIGYGPSSSHTMGPQQAMMVFMERYPNAENFSVTLFGSLALTGKGHLTDYIIEKTAAPHPVEIIWKPSKFLDEHPNAMEIAATVDEKKVTMLVYSIGGGNIAIAGEPLDTSDQTYPHNSFTDIAEYAIMHEMTLLEYIDHFDKDTEEHLRAVWIAMQESIARGLLNDDLLKGSLKLHRKAKLLYNPDHTPERNMSAYAYAVNEENASASGLVVTAPTCGACGTLPAVLRYAQEKLGVSEHDIIQALKIAGIFGTLIKTNASISGAEAGCQAEVGSATSMAAAALTFLQGGDIHAIEAAAEIAMEHQLGLTCDPVDGYVQIPCIQRNAVAAQKALVASTLAEDLRAVETVSFDTIIDVMYETGKDLPYAYRETSKGGLAIHYKRKKPLEPMC